MRHVGLEVASAVGEGEALALRLPAAGPAADFRRRRFPVLQVSPGQVCVFLRGLEAGTLLHLLDPGDCADGRVRADEILLQAQRDWQ